MYRALEADYVTLVCQGGEIGRGVKSKTQPNGALNPLGTQNSPNRSSMDISIPGNLCVSLSTYGFAVQIRVWFTKKKKKLPF